MELPIDAFIGYIEDICKVEPALSTQSEFQQKLRTVLSRFADTSVRVAASSSINKDVVIANWTDQELADAMQRHVAFRSPTAGTVNKIPNSAWSMMLEAAKRLRGKNVEEPDKIPSNP
jgi:hypothetical protein